MPLAPNHADRRAMSFGAPRRAAAALLAVIAWLASAGDACGARAERASLVTAEGERRYIVVRPDHVPAGPRPLVLVFHGHGGSAEGVLGLNGAPAPLGVWLTIADRESVLVAALEGTPGRGGGLGWNDCREDAAWKARTDDVTFVHAVVESLASEAGADTTRLYVMGMSLGGMMAYRLALELTPPPAAIAAMGGSMAENSECGAPTRPVSVLVIHGTDDPLVPYSGGQVAPRGPGGGRTLPIEKVVELWCRIDGITGAPVEEHLAHRPGGGDPTRTTRILYPVGPGGARVELMRVQGGGHSQPSLTRFSPRGWSFRFGPQSHDFECAEEAWSFFRDARAAP
jgi:polyhydroxybutyrate depolymerase